MRDLDVRIKSRVKGRPAITRSLTGLLLRAHRFARCRATSRADQHWAARVIDSLTASLVVARGDDDTDDHRTGAPS